jgi:hypothetical protein
LGAQPNLAATAEMDADLEPIRESGAFKRILDASQTIQDGGMSDHEEAVASR